MRTLIVLVVGIIGLLGLSGCQSGALNETVYNTLQNVQEQQCHDDPTQSCPPRMTYEEYQQYLSKRGKDGFGEPRKRTQ